MIHLSQAAASEINRLRSKQQLNSLFRLAVKPGGCSDLFYDVSFDQEIKESDLIVNIDNIQVVIDVDSCDYVKNLAIDYSEDLMGGGFRFQNPQAAITCSCGNSFSTTSSFSSS